MKICMVVIQVQFPDTQVSFLVSRSYYQSLRHTSLCLNNVDLRGLVEFGLVLVLLGGSCSKVPQRVGWVGVGGLGVGWVGGVDGVGR